MIKKLFIFLTLIAAFSVVALGQKKSTEQTLMDTEQKIVDSAVGGRFADIEKYYSPEYTVTTPDGNVLTLAQLVGALKSGDLKIESSVNSEMKVKVYGDMAIVTYRSADKGKFKGQDISGQYRWTDTFVKMNGKWLLVAGQGTPVMMQ